MTTHSLHPATPFVVPESRTDPHALAFAGDGAYEHARAVWNTAADLRPAAVASPRTATETQEVVAAARASGLRIAPVSTGHNAGPLAERDLSDTVLLKTSAMSGVVRIDPGTRTAYVGGGTEWIDVIHAAARHGLACLHGSSPDVGVAGYCLGGGIFLYARARGMATNAVTALELVLADGGRVRVDRETDPALFWALRGGGGNFGVVTALEFSLLPFADVHAGRMFFDLRDAEKVVRHWVRWAPSAPEQITTTLRILDVPPLPQLPTGLHGRRMVCIDGAVLTDDDRAAQLLAPLRELHPELDSFARVPVGELARLHMDPEGPTPVIGRSSVLRELPDAGVDAFLEQAVPARLKIAELRQLGGALARSHPDGGVMNSLDGQFLAFGAAIAEQPEEELAGERAADALIGALAPWRGAQQYLNFVEQDVDAEAGYPSGTWERLRGIRSRVDPDGVLLAGHAIPRAGSGSAW